MMHFRNKNSGLAIALAWPQTYCKQPGSWYDPVTEWLGINKNNYYRAGHAATVLIDIKNKKCHYFDFGRYHAPFRHGRVRSADTDQDLIIKTVPKISSDGKKILNFADILNELQQNTSCHGEGVLYASYCNIDFKSSISKANLMQDFGPILYGPFIREGSNCSRFVNSVIRAGNPEWKYQFRLKFFVPLTPTPLSNVKALTEKRFVPKLYNGHAFHPIHKLSIEELWSTLPAPQKHEKIPEEAQWLSGEGAGSWFSINKKGNIVEISRYSPEGKMECSGMFNIRGHFVPGDLKNYQITHPSNCREIHLKKSDTILRLTKVSASLSNLYKAV